jgi:hypothetical protein
MSFHYFHDSCLCDRVCAIEDCGSIRKAEDSVLCLTRKELQKIAGVDFFGQIKNYFIELKYFFSYSGTEIEARKYAISRSPVIKNAFAKAILEGKV